MRRETTTIRDSLCVCAISQVIVVNERGGSPCGEVLACYLLLVRLWLWRSASFRSTVRSKRGRLQTTNKEEAR